MPLSTSTPLLPEVAAFLAESPLKAVIGGRDTPASNGETFQTRDPGSKELLAEVSAMQPDDVDRAVRAAAEAFEKTAWATMPPNERGALLMRLADAIERRKPILAQIEALDAGKILAQADWDIQNFVDTLRYYANLAQHVERRTTLAVAGYSAYTARLPWGPCGFIFPWNFPFLLIGWNVPPALVAGNTVIIKPAEDTPLSAIYLARLARKVGIPDGVINVIPGLGSTTGAALAAHPGLRRMSFTGSPEVGRLIAAACGRNLMPVKLELGGKGAAVVFDDVDVARTAENLVGAITFHSGQVCCTASRWIVHQAIYPEFVHLCSERMKALRVGHEMDPAAQMGPVVNEKQFHRVLGYLQRGQEEGAEAVLPGGPADVSGRDGFYVRPALLAGSPENVAAREEIFGPVAFITPFRDESEAVRLVNATDYGLANSVWTADPDRAVRVAEQLSAGSSWINCHNVFPHGVPYAGIHKSGLGGGVLSPETLFDYWRSLSVVQPT
jgi:acyl-CoA reductase-like NAD-dependent aldehyde dehydrogenase